MKEIEKKIAHLVKSQFPAFYQEEGKNFIAFVEAYYEWLERSKDPGENSYNVNYQSRSLTEYRDIDTTLDEFLVQFKEKYLKNIQFDTATNKPLLIKNAMNLYRSKGSERSVDLFFKLVYGADADVFYPSERILRLSDGSWDRPQYIEIIYNPFNINYVGKQIIGARSGARAFVERYVRRKTRRGYVDLLYISNLQGTFLNNETLGINVDGNARFIKGQTANVVSSVRRATIITRGSNFTIGDIVNLTSQNRGLGAIARVANTTTQSGVVDFTVEDGGYGFSLTATPIVSEKVIGLDNIDSDGQEYFGIFEELTQPIINVVFSSATANLVPGDVLTRYDGGLPVANGVVIEVTQTGATGTATISHSNGVWTNSSNYYTVSNAASIFANTNEDRTISGQVMGLSNTINITIADVNGTFADGDIIEQGSPANNTLATGVVEFVNGSILTVNTVVGVFRDTALVSPDFRIVKRSDNTANAAVTNINTNVGVYSIRKYLQTITYDEANNDTIINSQHVFQYTVDGSVTATGKLVTGNFTANTGNLTFIPIQGTFTDNLPIYTDANSATADLSFLTVTETGGDYVADANTRMIGTTYGTYASPALISSGSGAGFNVGTLTEQEDVFTNVDLLNDFNAGYLDNGRRIVNIASNTGITLGDVVYQDVNKKAFNANTGVNPTTGFITLASADTLYVPGDIVYYEVAAGNTALTGLKDGDPYYVFASNSTGLILSYPWTHEAPLTDTSTVDFTSGAVNEEGHYFYKRIAGTVLTIGATAISVKDVYGGEFGATGGTANTTAISNSNAIIYTNETVNTSVSSVTADNSILLGRQKYMSVGLRQEGYGFPKFTGGNIKTDIYRCLTYNELTIGTIQSITNVNPGTDYNQDPFVLVYEPGIAGYRKDDFILDITNASKSFVVGERIIQTLPNETTAVMQLDTGVYGNTFTEVIQAINSDLDANSSNEFIYTPSNTALSFNANTDVNSNLEFISIANNTLANGQYVRYFTATGNTALTGLSNGSYYYVVSANDQGFALSLTEAGANIDITASATVESGHFILPFQNPYANNERVVYTVPTGNTQITGLTNGQEYYVVFANSIGFALSLTEGGANVDITSNTTGGETHYFTNQPGFLPLDGVYQDISVSFNANTDVAGDAITLSPQPFQNGDLITYTVSAGNTAIVELGANSQWYVVNSNSSAIKLSSTINGPAETITATSVSETGHFIESIATGTVQSAYFGGANLYVNVLQTDNTLANNFLLQSNTVTANVIGLAAFTLPISAEGIVQSGSTIDQLYVKRIEFSRDFEVGGVVTGESSAATANVIGIQENLDFYPIGLNAVVSGDASIADGQVSELDIIDSGFGYANNELVTFSTSDGQRTGTARVIVTGSGIGNGSYRGTSGFISDSNKLHDGDYYQEYSYEVLSRISVDRYSDMFKKVMHLAGTKFFGSVVVESFANTDIEITNSGTSQEVVFNALNDISNNTIDVSIVGEARTINPATSVDGGGEFITISANPFEVGDYVLYTTEGGNSATFGLSNNTFYWVITANGSGVQLSTTANGTAVDLTPGVNEWGHNLVGYINPYSDGDLLRYTVDTGNTALTGLENRGEYYVVNSTPTTISLSSTAGGNVINITAGSNENGHNLARIIEE